MDRVEMRISSNPIFERVVRASAAEIGQSCGFSSERVEDLKLAVSEAVNNAIEHGSRPGSTPVAVVFQLDDDKLEIVISDQGSGIDGIDPSRRIIEEQHLESGMLRGFGMYFITALVDDYEIASSQTGTVLTLRLYRKEHSV